MIVDLHIENIAVIERADVRFDPAFNVLTGETGAGKSIVIDAIDAVLGGRVSRELVRSGAERALVSAVFTDVSADAWLEENEIECDGELILQRRIGADGKSSCRVCGVPVTAQQLRALGGLLLDIHGQNDGRQLLDEARHLDYLDRFGDYDALRDAFSEAYGRWHAVKKEIERLSMDEFEKERRIARLTAEVEELEQAKLRIGEEAEMLSRADLMKNAGRVTEALQQAYDALYEADDNAIGLASEAARHASAAATAAPELADVSKSISDACFLLTDAAERINDFLQGLDFSEEEFDRMEARLSLLRRLERKYGADEAGLLDALDQRRRQLEEIESSADLLLALERDLKAAEAEALKAAEALSDARSAAAETLGARVEQELRELSMPSVRFRAELTRVQGKPGFNATGCDEVRFLMSANAGEAPGRISRIASGGELSRIMLAMKSVLAAYDVVDTLVFDEIDTGVSGIAAQRVGEKMGALARRRQILCVTHLPQIAAMADRHFSIQKDVRDGRTFTSVTPLDRDGRIRELARLHGGDLATDTALRAAAEQLDAAETYKKSVS
jgi:DNA repair protein RecN (Recombination protein N)